VFTPETTSVAPPGAVAQGNHFYSWSHLSDTLHTLWHLHLPNDTIANAEHVEMWTLLSEMLINVSNQVDLDIMLHSATFTQQQ
jgi:hypothetical protein